MTDSATLFTNIDVLATFDSHGAELREAAMLVRGPVIERIGPADQILAADDQVDRIVDWSGHVVLSGLINTHHHMYQNLTRCMVQDDDLFTWLTTLYPVWAQMDDAAVGISAKIAMAELMLSGCTTASDHLYILPNDCRIDTTIDAARTLGLRFHASRGAMSRGESQGGLPPDSCVEDEEAILRDTERLIHAHHDMSRHAMTRIIVAPCSPFSVTEGLMREAAQLARQHRGVRLHTHVAETLDEETYCDEMFGKRVVGFCESVDWVGDDVWYAHAIFLNDREIRLLAETGTGATFCPSAHMRLGSGIMRAREMLDAGVTVGFGVDGSASNDGGNLFLEARLGIALQRVAPTRYLSEAPGGRGGFAGSPKGLSAREALAMATNYGAKLLGRDDIGHLAPGMSADFIAIKRDHISLTGTQRDPVAALLWSGPFTVDQSVINGVQVIEDGAFTAFDLPAAIAEHAQTMQRLYDV
ncbi:MAG: 8-oxoguanine deaminase [Devosiaceae bacterium]|nr:8-oxoguanine deaminase [Devosiaceae bacterium MH13]